MSLFRAPFSRFFKAGLSLLMIPLGVGLWVSGCAGPENMQGANSSYTATDVISEEDSKEADKDFQKIKGQAGVPAVQPRAPRDVKVSTSIHIDSGSEERIIPTRPSGRQKAVNLEIVEAFVGEKEAHMLVEIQRGDKLGRVRLEGNVGPDSCLSLLPKDKKVEGCIDLKDPSPVSQTQGRLRAVAVCLDVPSCNSFFVDVYYKVADEVMKKQFIYEPLKEGFADTKEVKESVDKNLKEAPGSEGLNLDHGEHDPEDPNDPLLGLKGEYVGVRVWDKSRLEASLVNLAVVKEEGSDSEQNAFEDSEELKDESAEGGRKESKTPAVGSNVAPPDSRFSNDPRKNETAPITAPEEDWQHDQGQVEGVRESLAPSEPEHPSSSSNEVESLDVGGNEESHEFFLLHDPAMLFALNLDSGGESIGFASRKHGGGKIRNSSALEPFRGTGYRKVNTKRERQYGSGFLVELLKDSSRIMIERLGYADNELIISDLSQHGGGDVSGHGSHENGLDVDVAYLEGAGGSRHFRDVVDDDGNVAADFDYQRNWDFFQLVVNTGMVKYIFVDKNLKKAICQWAKPKGLLNTELGQETMRRLFPWSAHDDHFHLRLKCSPYHVRCRNQKGEPSFDPGC